MNGLSLVVALLAAAPIEGAAPEIRETTTFYDVTGRTADDLRKAMNAAGPTTSEGRHVDTVSSWKVHYTYQTALRASGCQMSRVKVTGDISTTLPRWADKPADPSALVERWEKYGKALAATGEPLRDIGRRTAVDLQESLGALPAQPTCEALDDLVGRTAEGVIERHVRENDEYNKAKASRPEPLRFP